MFDQIIYASKGKQIVTFLDYDGTLSPIVADPDKAYMSKKVCLLFHSLFLSLISIQFIKENGIQFPLIIIAIDLLLN